MIIVLDTNVLASGILKPYSKAATLLRLVADGATQLAYDVRLLSEYRDVLNRSKFDFPKDQVEEFLQQVEQEGFLASARPSKFRLPDPDDEPFIGVAVSGGAIALVTSNKRHFPRKEYEGVKILSPAEFLEVLKKRI